MHDGQGEVIEVYLDPLKAAQIACPPNLIPTPGQYLLAYVEGSDSSLAAPLFVSGFSPAGFIIAPPSPVSWRPGSRLHLRGPLGCGFTMPASAGHVALLAYRNPPVRLLPLMEVAFKQSASVVLISDSPPESLPLQVEVQPLAWAAEVCGWADYFAIDIDREALDDIPDLLQLTSQTKYQPITQVLVRAPMPCGGLAKCGVCTVAGQREDFLACEAGPVFDLKDLL